MSRRPEAAPAGAPDFEEHKPYEEGFAAIYRRDIVPLIPALEAQRRRAVQEAWLRGSLVAAGAGVIAYLSPDSWRWLTFIFLVIGLLISMEAGFVGRFVQAQLRAYRERRTRVLLRAVGAYTPDCGYREDLRGAPSPDMLSGLAALQGVDRTYFSYVAPDLQVDWAMEGRYRGLTYAVLAGQVTVPGGASRLPGIVLLAVEAPGPVPGRTEVHFGTRPPDDIESHVPPFEVLHRVEADDVAADPAPAVFAKSDTLVPPFLTAAVLDSLQRLAPVLESRAPPPAFDQGKAWIFPVFVLDDQATDPPAHRYEQEVRAYLRLMNLVFRTIDALRGDLIEAVE